jgi:hypothetical protein
MRQSVVTIVTRRRLNIWSSHARGGRLSSNIDETGFALGTTLPSKGLIRGGDIIGFKKISGRQEWITAIECIGASGIVLPPLLIFRAKHTNTAWIPASTPENWKFPTSTSRWTSDIHAYEWLILEIWMGYEWVNWLIYLSWRKSSTYICT